LSKFNVAPGSDSGLFNEVLFAGVKPLKFQVDTQAISAGVELMTSTVAEFSEPFMVFIRRVAL
jgi:hypothetical protein